MEQWTPAASLQIVSDNLVPRLSARNGRVDTRFLLSHFFHRFHQNHPAKFHKNSPGFSNYLAHFFLQNPSLQPAFHRMPVEGGVI